MKLKVWLVVIFTILVVAIGTVLALYFAKIGPFAIQTSDIVPVELDADQPLVDPFDQNVINYQLEEPEDIPQADPNDGYPRKLVRTKFLQLTTGDVIIKVQTEETKDKKATCRLILNGKLHSTVKAEDFKTALACKDFLIHSSALQDGTNTYEIFFDAEDYKDRYYGEFIKR